MPAQLEALIGRWQRLQADRAPWDADDQDIAELLCPQRAKALTHGLPGDKITARIFEAEGMVAPTLLAAALHGNLTNPATAWYGLTMRDDDLMDVDEVQDWCEDSRNRELRAFNASNFGNEIATQYLDGPLFGRGALLMEERDPDRPGVFPGFLFTSLPIGTFCLAENFEGRVDTLFAQHAMSLRAAYSQWGVALGKELLERHAKDADQAVTLIHAIYPRADADRTPVNGRRRRRAMPFASVWFWAEGDGALLDEGGYQEFPGAVWRWDRQNGEVYGRGRGVLALPDVKTLNRQTELKYGGVALDIIPPTYEQQGVLVGEHIREPGARNYVKGDPAKALTSIGTGTRYDIMQLNRQELIESIRRVFFVDQVLALPPTDKPHYLTAFEVAKRLEQMAKLLGPAFGRITGELLSPLIERGIRILARWGALQPMPDLLRQVPNAELDIRYEGALARAQHAEDLSAIEQKNLWLKNRIELAVAAGQPGLVQPLLDNFDDDAEAQTVARIVGLPAKITRGKDQVAEIRAQRSQQEQAAQMQQGVMAIAEAAGKAAPALKLLQPQEAAA